MYWVQLAEGSWGGLSEERPGAALCWTQPVPAGSGGSAMATPQDTAEPISKATGASVTTDSKKDKRLPRRCEGKSV